MSPGKQKDPSSSRDERFSRGTTLVDPPGVTASPLCFRDTGGDDPSPISGPLYRWGSAGTSRPDNGLCSGASGGHSRRSLTPVSTTHRLSMLRDRGTLPRHWRTLDSIGTKDTRERARNASVSRLARPIRPPRPQPRAPRAAGRAAPSRDRPQERIRNRPSSRRASSTPRPPPAPCCSPRARP